MHRTEGDAFVVVGGKNLFTDGPPGTQLTASWQNAVQEEIINVITEAGLSPQTVATETRNQLIAALKILFVEPDAGEILTNKTIAFGSNTLTDVASTNTGQTLTNKTIVFGDNTLTDVASTNTGQTLTNKTINSTGNTLTIDSTDANTTIAIDTSEALTTLDLDTADAGTTVDINSADAGTTVAIDTSQAGTSFTLDSADAGTDVTLDGTDATTSMSNVESIEETGTNTYELKYKYIDIGDWNMNASAAGSASVNVAHGLTFGNIINVQATIRQDLTGIPLFNLENSGDVNGGGYVDIGTTNITLHVVLGGFFDNASFDQTSFNRGWVLITYKV
jgi:hypothetical protein